MLGRTDPLEEPGAAVEHKRSVKEDIEERINSGGGLVRYGHEAERFALRGQPHSSDDVVHTCDTAGHCSGATKGLGASFTQQSKLDADQQMYVHAPASWKWHPARLTKFLVGLSILVRNRIDYIEREMKKRKGIVDEAQPAQTKDMLAELYTIPEHLRARTAAYHMKSME